MFQQQLLRSLLCRHFVQIHLDALFLHLNLWEEEMLVFSSSPRSSNEAQMKLKRSSNEAQVAKLIPKDCGLYVSIQQPFPWDPPLTLRCTWRGTTFTGTTLPPVAGWFPRRGCVKLQVQYGRRPAVIQMYGSVWTGTGSPAFWYGSGVRIGLWVQGMDRGFTYWLAAKSLETQPLVGCKILGQIGHPISSDIIQHHPTSSNIVQHCPTSANIIQHHPTSSKVIQHHPTSSNIIQTSSNISQHHPTSSNVIQRHPTLSNIIQRHPTSSNNIQHHPTSANIIQHHPTSSNIIQQHPTSSDIIQRHPTSSNILQNYPTSSNIVQKGIIWGLPSSNIPRLGPCMSCWACLLGGGKATWTFGPRPRSGRDGSG